MTSDDSEPVTRMWTFAPAQMFPLTTQQLTEYYAALEKARADFAAYQRERRNEQYSAAVGYTLTEEQCDTIDRTASYGILDARHILRILRAEIAEEEVHGIAERINERFQVLRNHSTQLQQTLNDTWDVYNTPQPNYDHWWIGLERQHTYTNTQRGRTNERGRNRNSTYGHQRPSDTYSSRAASYWRHTTTR